MKAFDFVDLHQEISKEIDKATLAAFQENGFYK